MTVKEYRKKSKKTQLELSVELCISIQQLQKIEQGKILLEDVKFKTVKKLFDKLNITDVSIDMFVCENDWAIEWENAKKSKKG